MLQNHNHTKRCETYTGACRYGFPKQPVKQTTVRSFDYNFARDAGDEMIVGHNTEILSYFRTHHCLEIIHSEQCISYVLKYSVLL